MNTPAPDDEALIEVMHDCAARLARYDGGYMPDTVIMVEAIGRFRELSAELEYYRNENIELRRELIDMRRKGIK